MKHLQVHRRSYVVFKPSEDFAVDCALSPLDIGTFKCFIVFLRATAGTAIARLSHRNSVRLSVRLSVRPSVCHTGESGKNGAS